MPPFAQRLQDARQVHARGDAAQAARLFGSLNRERPSDPAVLHPLGVALAQVGRLAEAEAHLTRAADLAPESPDVLFDLGVLRDAQGRPAEAESAFRRVVEAAPDHARAWEALGLIRRDRGDFTGSAEAYARVAALEPGRIDLVLSAAEPMPPSAGADFLIDALLRFPGEAKLLQPLAEMLIRADRLEEAEAVLQTLRGLRHEPALVARHLGAVYGRLGRLPEAAGALYESIKHNPNDPETWSLLSMVREGLGDPDGSAAAAGRAVHLRPDDPGLVGMEARLLQHAGRLDAAHAKLDALPERARKSGEVRLLRGMLMPPILASNAQIDALRERWMETMADLEARPAFVPEPWDTVAVTGYFLGYHGREDRPLIEAYARASLATSPHLAHTARALGSGEAKVRVGFLSAHMRQHSVGRVLIDLMGGLDRSKFEVVLFQVPDKRNAGQDRAEAAADRTVRLIPRLDAARTAIEAERPDVLVYCDLHLNPFVDALSHSRLAPVQATTWGHPGTGGHESLDYWVSAEDWEPEGNERLYTERLVRLERAPYVTARPELPEKPLDRRALGLREDARLYGCLQSLFKIHPDYDEILAAILAGDPKARLVFVDGPHYTWREALRARFAHSFDVARVDFLPQMPYKTYLSATAACDVILDPIHFGGANTTYDAFALGKPVVTLPGGQMRNRATLGFYRQMEYEDLVADSPASYVALAHRAAQDRAFAREARETIHARSAVLFDNPAPIQDFSDWLERVR